MSYVIFMLLGAIGLITVVYFVIQAFCGILSSVKEGWDELQRNHQDS